ncbi:MAG TPA: hypothetical protein VFN67_36280, partial [Polyangiales bacterium]|nr:hypothetical protein [Polyangiales bacterium]
MAYRFVSLCLVAALGCSGSTAPPGSDPSAIMGGNGASGAGPIQPGGGSTGSNTAQAGTTGARPMAGTLAAVSGAGGMTGAVVGQDGSAGRATVVDMPGDGSAPAITASWPTFGGDLNHTRSNPLE